jgi:hypothetical protein
MKRNTRNFSSALGALLVGALAAVSAAAQSVPGEATAARIVVGGGTPVTAAHAVLTGTEMVESSVSSISLSRVTSGLATAMSTGEAGAVGVTSVASVGDLNLLSGLIRATTVIAIATSTLSGADANGSGFEGLTVKGLPVGTGGVVAPNTRIDLPGVGYVVLNEQIRSGTAITVNMIRLVQNATLLSPKTEIVIASARSGA